MVAANIAVGGRITTADGDGISRAPVTLTDINGTTRATLTNAFGYYEFDNVEAGQTYFVSATHKPYQFDPPTCVLFATYDLSDVDFSALP